MSTESEASSFVEIYKGCLNEVVIRRSTFVFNSEVWIEDEKLHNARGIFGWLVFSSESCEYAANVFVLFDLLLLLSFIDFILFYSIFQGRENRLQSCHNVCL